MKLTDKQKKIYKILLTSGIDWYVCETRDGDIVVNHSTNLSSILSDSYTEEECGFKWIKKCLGNPYGIEDEVEWGDYYLDNHDYCDACGEPDDIVKWEGEDELGRECMDLCE